MQTATRRYVTAYTSSVAGSMLISSNATSRFRLLQQSSRSAPPVCLLFFRQVLCHLSQGMSRALSCLPRQHWPHAPLALHPVSWITALLRETTAAAEAVTHWEPALASAGATGDVSDGWVKGLDWACLDACMALTGLLSTPLAGRTVNGTAAAATATAAAAAAAASSRPGSASAERLPAGVVEQEVLVGVLVDALQALQWTPDALLHLLRCLRRVWALAVQDGELQVG